MNKLVSIIIPIYNGGKYIKKCLNTVINQTYKNIEVILIDDGSSDNSLELCNDFQKKDQRIKVIHKENGGVSSARNVGLENVSGYYFTFIDIDDTIELDMIESLVNSIETNNVDIAICGYNYEFPNKLKENVSNKESIEGNEFLYAILYDNSIGGYLWNKLYKVSLISDNKISFSSDIKILEDELFNLSIFDNNRNIRCSIVNKSLYNYVINSGSALNRFNKNNLTLFDALEREIEFLKLNSYDYNNKMVAYVISTTKLRYVLKKIKMEKEYNINSILKKSKEYRKTINVNNISLKRIKIKYLLALYIPFYYKIKVYIGNNYSIV